jgi:AAA domain
MSFQFKPAIRESVGLLIGLAGASGSGKTFSAMRLAMGMAGDKPFCVIDTEAGRAKHYADQFKFDHGDLAPPFSPERYAEAIAAADAQKYPVIVVDSMSHSWEGDGGVLDMHEAELERMAGDDFRKREAVKMAAWIKPKMQHKKMVQQLLQIRAHLILCFRAEEKIEMVRGDDGKMKIVPKQSLTGINGWTPICDKRLPYELTASILLTADNPGCPKPIKLQAQHRAMFPLDVPINEEAGKKIAQWAGGGKPQEAAPSAAAMDVNLVNAFIAKLNEARSMDQLKHAYEAALEMARKAKDNVARVRLKTAKTENEERLMSAALQTMPKPEHESEAI